MNRPTSASRLSKQISIISAQSLGLASVVLGVPFDASEREYTAPTLTAVRDPSFNSRFAATGTFDPGWHHDNGILPAIALAPSNFNLERVRGEFRDDPLYHIDMEKLFGVLRHAAWSRAALPSDFQRIADGLGKAGLPGS